MKENIAIMSTAEIIEHNYRDLDQSARASYGIYKLWDTLGSMVPYKKDRLGLIQTPRYIVLKYMIEGAVKIGHMPYTPALAAQMFKMVNLEAYLYNWGKHKVIFEIDDDFVRMARSKYKDLSKEKIGIDLFETIPNGVYINGPIDNGCAGMFVYLDLVPSDISETETIQTIVFCNTDKLRLTNFKRTIERKDPFGLISVCMPCELLMDSRFGDSVEDYITGSSDMMRSQGSDEISSRMLNMNMNFEKADEAQRNMIKVLLFLRDWVINKHSLRHKEEGDVTVFYV